VPGAGCCCRYEKASEHAELEAAVSGIARIKEIWLNETKAEEAARAAEEAKDGGAVEVLEEGALPCVVLVCVAVPACSSALAVAPIQRELYACQPNHCWGQCPVPS